MRLRRGLVEQLRDGVDAHLHGFVVRAFQVDVDDAPQNNRPQNKGPQVRVTPGQGGPDGALSGSGAGQSGPPEGEIIETPNGFPPGACGSGICGAEACGTGGFGGCAAPGVWAMATVPNKLRHTAPVMLLMVDPRLRPGSPGLIRQPGARPGCSTRAVL